MRYETEMKERLDTIEWVLGLLGPSWRKKEETINILEHHANELSYVLGKDRGKKK